MRGRTVMVVVGLTALAVWALGGLGSAGAAGMAPSHITIETAGVGYFSPNGYFKETLHFADKSYTIATGGTITFEKGPQDHTPDPHTITVVKPSQVPATVLAVQLCLGDVPGSGCAIGDSAKGPVLNAGAPGLNEPGDSYQLFPNHQGKFAPLTIKVSAPAGTTLNFICAVHPWMQAVLHVAQ